MWTLLFSMALAAVFTVLGFFVFNPDKSGLGSPAAVRRWGDGQRSLFFGGVPLLGLAMGWPLGIWLSGSSAVVFPALQDPRGLLATVTLGLGISVALHFYFVAKGKQLAAEARATEAQLRLLQGQI